MVTRPRFEKYKRELFPLQAHASTAIAKRLKTQKSVILQGEMSNGKSTMMAAITDGLAASIEFFISKKFKTNIKIPLYISYYKCIIYILKQLI